MSPIITHQDELELAKTEKELVSQLKKVAKWQRSVVNSQKSLADNIAKLNIAKQSLNRTFRDTLKQMQTLANEVSKLQGYPIVNDMKLTITKNLSSVKQEKEEEPEEESLSMRDIQRNFRGLLGKKLMKDVLDKKAEKKTEEPQKTSVLELFHMKTEVKDITGGNIASSKFEVNKGYKLKKN